MLPELVRDKVPELLKLQGLNPDYRLSPEGDGERYDLVRNKFVNVCGEATLALKLGKPEEIQAALAKVLDMVSVVAKQHKIKVKDIRAYRDQLRAMKGGHDDFVVLMKPHNTFDNR